MSNNSSGFKMVMVAIFSAIATIICIVAIIYLVRECDGDKNNKSTGKLTKLKKIIKEKDNEESNSGENPIMEKKKGKNKNVENESDD